MDNEEASEIINKANEMGKKLYDACCNRTHEMLKEGASIDVAETIIRAHLEFALASYTANVIANNVENGTQEYFNEVSIKIRDRLQDFISELFLEYEQSVLRFEVGEDEGDESNQER